MVSKFALSISTLLLASTALAVPFSQLEALFAHHHEKRQSQSTQPGGFLDSPTRAATLDSPDILYSSNWAGALWQQSHGTFVSITGTLTVPHVEGNEGGASMWVGIDGWSCKSAIVQVGIEFTIRNGVIEWAAWYEWLPNPAQYFPAFGILTYDVIKLTITLISLQSAVVTIENKTTGRLRQQTLNSPYTLCAADAEWIVEDYIEDGVRVPLADFDVVTFSDAVASGYGPTKYFPFGASPIFMKQRNLLLTYVETYWETVTIRYIRHQM